MRIGRVKLSRHWLTVVMAAVVATLSALLWPPEGFLDRVRGVIGLLAPAHQLDTLLAPAHQLEWSGYDALFALRGPRPNQVAREIIIVGFDRDTEKALDIDGVRGVPWPPPRRFHARVIKNLVADGAAVIAYDVLMSDPSNPKDDAYIDGALANAGNVILVCRIERSASQKSKVLEEPYYDDALEIDFERNTHIGFAEVMPDNGVVRRFVPAWKFQDEWLPSLPAMAYLKRNGKSEEDINITTRSVRLGELRIPRTGPMVEDIVDKWEIMSTYMDFPGGLATFPMVRFDQVYYGTFAPGTFRNKIVFVGITGTELTKKHNDSYRTAYSTLRPESVGGMVTRDIPGVVLQAQIYNAMRMKSFIRLAPWWVVWLIVFVFALLGTWFVRHYANWRGPALLLASVFAYMLVAVVLFTDWRMHLPWVIPNLLIVLSAGSLAWVERGRLRQKWSGYVSPAVLDVILRQDAELGARRVEATVIFGDIRNFTGFSEKHSPETVVRLINRHFEKLTKIIYDEGGTIDKFLGDGILVVIGAPLPVEDAALRAVRASWKMREAALIPIIDTDGKEHTLATGFGITTGPFVSGHVGSRARHEFTIIGDTVNLASRLQGVTGQPDVIIDTNTLEQVRDHVEVEPLGEVTLKGKSQPVPCFKVTAWRDEP